MLYDKRGGGLCQTVVSVFWHLLVIPFDAHSFSFLQLHAIVHIWNLGACTTQEDIIIFQVKHLWGIWCMIHPGRMTWTYFFHSSAFSSGCSAKLLICTRGATYSVVDGRSSQIFEKHHEKTVTHNFSDAMWLLRIKTSITISLNLRSNATQYYFRTIFIS